MVKKMAWVFLAAAIAMASPATAQENACEADQKTFCSKSEGLHILKCLVDHYDELSPGCKTQIEPARARIQSAKPPAAPADAAQPPAAPADAAQPPKP